jgi:hypothetical protein
MLTKQEIAIAACVEAYRDHMIPAETARVILQGLNTPEWQIQQLAHHRQESWYEQWIKTGVYNPSNT